MHTAWRALLTLLVVILTCQAQPGRASAKPSDDGPRPGDDQPALRAGLGAVAHLPGLPSPDQPQPMPLGLGCQPPRLELITQPMVLAVLQPAQGPALSNQARRQPGCWPAAG